MRRGDVVTVALSGDLGKPRPAVIVQSNAVSADHASVIVCPMTSDLSATLPFRVAIEPTKANGLRRRSHIMSDKPIAVRRDRVGPCIGALDASEMRAVNRAISFVLGLLD